MRSLVLFVLVVLPSLALSQSYKIDGGSIVVSKIVEDIEGSTGEIYGRVKSFFVRSYGDANSVIQTDDKEGGLIIGKGLYTKLASFNLGAWTLKAYHTLRVDIKQGRARIICSASTVIPNSSSYPGNTYEYVIVDHAPITDKRASGATKGAQKEAFDNLVARMNSTVDALAEAVKGGGLLESEKDDW